MVVGSSCAPDAWWFGCRCGRAPHPANRPNPKCTVAAELVPLLCRLMSWCWAAGDGMSMDATGIAGPWGHALLVHAVSQLCMLWLVHAAEGEPKLIPCWAVSHAASQAIT